MNIYTYLKKDHRVVADLMDRVVKEPSARAQLFERIKHELTLHADAEEITFYQTLERASRSKAAEEKVEHAYDEHADIRKYLDKLSSLRVTTDEWMITFGEFKYAVTHHVEEEEGEIFEKAKKYLSEAQERDLAIQMDALKKEATAKTAA